MCLCTNGKHLQVKTHSQTILYTWVFEEDSFSPIAKIKNDKQYSIINDHLGTPIEAYADDGKLIWERSLNSNGKVLKETGFENFCQFLYQGQSYDSEIELAYNRFRYYDPEEGRYISQDPIGLLGGFELYAYVFDSNSQVDLFGLAAMPWHHLIPQEMMKNPNFMKQLNQITGNAKTYIHRQGAFVEEGLHKAIHKGAGGGLWNDAFNNWYSQNRNFSKRDIQNQLKKMMKDFKIPKSSRDFARKYKRKTKTKFKCK